MRLAGELALWLADNAALSLAELHDSFCRMLVADGLPIWRAVLGTETLHPEQLGGQLVWRADGEQTEMVYAHGVEQTSSYLDSPLRVVDETGKRGASGSPGTAPNMPLLLELQQAGATDYLMVPFPFLDRTRSASMSFATRAAKGFSDEHLQRLELAANLISPYAERLALRRIAVDLLDTYVGRHAGERIFQGKVQRGAVDRIDAAILMADLRGFTALSNARGLTHVIETLDAWFECVAAAIASHGGEILKFMGDGLLAIFPAHAEPADACRRAADAALDSLLGVELLNAGRAAEGNEPVAFVVGLHVGEVAYGNIGGRRRLDFTVLGPAVNYASRLQDLAKSLDRPILASSAFASQLSEPAVAVGTHPLRGIGDAEEVFALPLSA